MSTRGTYGIIRDDHCYLVYQDSDMYPEGHPAELFQEAADIARKGEWEQVIEGWTTKAWLHEKDDELPQEVRSRVRHPDGDEYQRADWSYGMRPRMSRQQMEEDGRADAAAMMFEPDAEHWLPIWGRPSFRQGADMPAMLRDGIDAGWLAFSVIVDTDNNQIVLSTHYGDGSPYLPIAVASMDSPDEIDSILEWMDCQGSVQVDDLDPRPANYQALKAEIDWVEPKYLEAAGFHSSVGGPPAVPLNPYDTYEQRWNAAMKDAPSREDIVAGMDQYVGRRWSQVTEDVKNGAWLRPDGFPAFPKTPDWFPALDYIAQRGTSADVAETAAQAAVAPTAVGKPDTETRGRKSRFTTADQIRHATRAKTIGARKVAEDIGASTATIYNWQKKHGIK